MMHFFDEDCCARLLRVAASDRVSPLETTLAAAPCRRTSATLDLRNRIRPGVVQIRCLQLRNVAELVRKLREALERRCSFAAREVEARRKSGLMLISVADSCYALARCVGEHSANVAGRLLNALCLLCDRLCHDARPRRDGIWRRSRDAPLPYCARLEPLDFSG